VGSIPKTSPERAMFQNDLCGRIKLRHDGRTKYPQLVDLLYSCADGQSSWLDFIDQLGVHLQASLVCIANYESSQAIVGIDSGDYDNYRKHYANIHPWYANTNAFPEGKVILTQELECP
jgi:hypothetical protein